MVEISMSNVNRLSKRGLRAAIIHVSIHHHNTAKIADAMAMSIGAECLTVAQAMERSSEDWDLVGLGSGIFFGSHHRSLLKFADRWQHPPTATFLFSTAGLPSLGWFWHRSLRSILTRQQIPIVDEACFPGWDTVGPLRWIGGIQRGRPNQRDLARAASFALHVVEQTQKDTIGYQNGTALEGVS
jgi:hypothetical protein